MTSPAPPPPPGDYPEASDDEMAVDGEEERKVWSPEHGEALKELVQSNTLSIPWPSLKEYLKHELHSNITDFLALSSHTNPPVLVPKAPLTASTSLAVTATSSSSTEDSIVGGESSKVEGEEAQTSATSDGLVKQDEKDEGEGKETVEAKVDPGQVIGGRTLPAFMLKEETAVLEERVVRLLDSFESKPPFTIQRAAELISLPYKHHVSVGKYLRAILRVLDVSSEWTAPSAPLASSSSAGGPPGPLPLSSSTGSWIATPLFSPIPFLARDDVAEDEGADKDDGEEAKAGMSPMSLGSPLPIRSSPPPSKPGTSPLPQIATLQSPPGSTAPLPAADQPTTTGGHPTTLSSDELIVDELDAGPISSSTTGSLGDLGAGEGGLAHEGEGKEQHAHLLAASPIAFSTTTTVAHLPPFDSPSSSSPSRAPATPPSTGRVRPREEDEEMDGVNEEDGEEARGVRSKSPTPDVRRLERTAPVATPTALDVEEV